MITQMQEFVAEQSAAIQGQFEKMAKESVENVRETVVGSAETLKSLKSPVRTIARSGVKTHHRVADGGGEPDRAAV